MLGPAILERRHKHSPEGLCGQTAASAMIFTGSGGRSRPDDVNAWHIFRGNFEPPREFHTLDVIQIDVPVLPESTNVAQRKFIVSRNSSHRPRLDETLSETRRDDPQRRSHHSCLN